MNLKNNVIGQCRRLFNQSKISALWQLENKPLCCCIAVAFLFYFPILYASAYHADDVSRAISGWYLFSGAGRFLLSGVAHVYSSFNSLIVDFHPLNQVLCILCLAISSFFVYKKFNSIVPRFALFLGLIFLINPFFLNNLLYRYDSLGFSIGYLLVVVAFSIADNWYAFLFKVFFLVAALCCYQPLINIFIGLIAIQIIFESKNLSLLVILKKHLSNGLAFVFSAICYKILAQGASGASARGQLLELDSNFISALGSNFNKAFDCFIRFWLDFPYFLWPVLVMVGIALLKLTYDKQWNRLLVILASVCLVYLSGLGGMALLKSPLIDPRVLNYFPIVLMLCFSIIGIAFASFRYLILLPIIASFIFSSRVGNVHRIQTDFEKPILYSACVDIEHVKRNYKIKTFNSIGGVKKSKYLENILNVTPFNGFLARSGWQTVGRLNEYCNGRVSFLWSSSYSKMRKEYLEREYPSSAKIIDRYPFYEIRINGDKAWIVWH